MTGHAAFCFDRRVLKGERAGFIRVAVEAKLVLRSSGAQLMSQKAAVRVMTITAGDQAFIDFVMKRLGKIGFHIEMAGIAELRLGSLQQLRLYLGRMNTMTIDAADVVLDMFRAQEVCVLLAKLMAAQATL